MDNFYDRWLNVADKWKEQCAAARKYIHEEELEWVKTKQDFRVALLCSRENGFLTPGDIMLAEIPAGRNTGQHYHGEEAIYIIKGTGCTVIDGVRYDWEPGACIFIPFGCSHQHFNLGIDTVRYFSVMAFALEVFAGVAKVFQFENAAETHLHALDGIPMADSDVHPELGRIIMRSSLAPSMDTSNWGDVWSKHTDEYSQTLAPEMKTPGGKAHRGKYLRFMRWQDSGFKAKEVHITGIAYDAPGKASGRHGHMEAILYCLEGEGYSIIDDEKIDWKEGTLIHVPGPATVHQHFNTGQIEARHIRVNYGLRSDIFQPIAKRIYPYRYYEFSDYDD